MKRARALCTTTLSAIILITPDASGTTKNEPPITAPSPSSTDGERDTVHVVIEGDDAETLDAVQRPDSVESPTPDRVLPPLAVEPHAEPEQLNGEATSTKEGDADDSAPAPWDPLAITPEDGDYARFIKGEVKRIVGMNLFGNSSTLPKGYLTLKYDFTNTRAGSRFDEYGKRGPIINPISFAQNGEQIIKANLDVEGHGGGHGFAVSYGILDELDAFFEVPFTFMTLELTPRLDPVYTDEEGKDHTVRPTTVYPSLLGIEDTVGYNAQDFLYDTWPKLGRQSPANAYKGRWLMGDIGLGLMYNYFRNEHLSSAVRTRVTLPTGKVQDPNNSILYATGPAIETGLGGWAVSGTHILDVRLPKFADWFDVILTTELELSYAFPQRRPYPTNFSKPLPVASEIDPDTFVDLSELEGEFTFTPGFGVGWFGQVGVSIYGISLGFAYGVQYRQAAWIDGDDGFIRMAKGLGLVGQSELQSVQVGASIPLLPLYIPASISVSYRKAIAGYNAIVYEDYVQVSVTGALPLGPLVEGRHAGTP